MKIFFWVDFLSSKDKNFWYLYSIKIFRFVNLTIEFTEQKFNGHHSVECLKKHEFVLRFYEILEKLYALKVVKIFDSGILSLNGLVSFFRVNLRTLFYACLSSEYSYSKFSWKCLVFQAMHAENVKNSCSKVKIPWIKLY